METHRKRGSVEKSAKTKGMVQKRVTAQGWLGSTPEGQCPQIRGLRAGGALAVASSIPATQLSSPASLAERVVTPHAPMTLGANHVSRAPEGDPAAAGDLRLGHRAPGRGGRQASVPLPALTTLLSALKAFCFVCANSAFSQQISTFYGPSVQAMETRLGARQRRRPPMVHRGSAPTPHASSGQWPAKTKRARARSCASVVTRKRPSLNRTPLICGRRAQGPGGTSQTSSSGHPS